MTNKQLAEAIRLKNLGLNYTEISEYLGVHYSRVRKGLMKAFKANEEIDEAIDDKINNSIQTIISGKSIEFDDDGDDEISVDSDALKKLIAYKVKSATYGFKISTIMSKAAYRAVQNLNLANPNQDDMTRIMQYLTIANTAANNGMKIDIEKLSLPEKAEEIKKGLSHFYGGQLPE